MECRRRERITPNGDDIFPGGGAEPSATVRDSRAPGILADLAQVAGAEPSHGNSLEILENGDEIFPSMLKAISVAKRSVKLLTYVYWEGEIAVRFANALARKAEEGVDCQLLLDAHGSLRMRKSLLDRMQEAGVVVAKYNPFDWKHILRYQHRTHRKILVCDSAVGFIGGVGIADEWQGNARSPDEWHDFHFRVTGPAVASLARAFRDNWESPWTKLRGDDSLPPDLPFEPAPDRTVPPSLKSDETLDDITLLPLTSAPSNSNSRAQECFKILVRSARRRLRITTAYLIPDRMMIDLLVRRAREGLEIEIVMPGQINDSCLAQSRSRSRWGELVAAGIRLYCYQPTMCHAKSVIVDDSFTTVGSINFDLLSFRLNEEANLIVHSEMFTAQMIEKFEADRACSQLVTAEWLENRNLFMRLKERVSNALPLPWWPNAADY